MSTIPEILDTAHEHHRAGRWQQAQQLYQQVLAADPLNADALHLFGLLAHQAGQNEAAVSLLSQAIRVHGSAPDFHNNLGEAYRALGRYPEAAAAYQQAIRLYDNFAEAHNNLGTIYQRQGHFEDALKCFDRAIACRPDYANAHSNRALTWLTMGNFEQGWAEHEWRWKRAEFYRREWPQPAWDGSPRNGRTLLIQAEQGLGDTLQFVRYLSLLGQSDGAVWFEPQPALIPLLTRSGFQGLIAPNAGLPSFDVQTTLLSLPHLLHTTLESVPAATPYLSADPERVVRWRDKLRDVTGFRVGIHWQGNPQSPLEPWRSIPLALFKALASIPAVRLVSLQKGFGVEQIPLIADQFAVLDLSPDLDSDGGAFIDTAAVMSVCDLIVTSDSATAHLAGALGLPVWIALCAAADWRWLHGRTDSPWYPTMRLFRQPRHTDWRAVFEEIANQLTAVVRQKHLNA